MIQTAKVQTLATKKKVILSYYKAVSYYETLVHGETTQKLCSVLCQLLSYKNIDFSYMERPTVRKNQRCLAVCKCSRLCMNFRAIAFGVYIGLFTKF